MLGHTHSTRVSAVHILSRSRRELLTVHRGRLLLQLSDYINTAETVTGYQTREEDMHGRYDSYSQRDDVHTITERLDVF